MNYRICDNIKLFRQLNWLMQLYLMTYIDYVGKSGFSQIWIWFWVNIHSLVLQNSMKFHNFWNQHEMIRNKIIIKKSSHDNTDSMIWVSHQLLECTMFNQPKHEFKHKIEENCKFSFFQMIILIWKLFK
jgi:hypothetical protein